MTLRFTAHLKMEAARKKYYSEFIEKIMDSFKQQILEAAEKGQSKTFLTTRLGNNYGPGLTDSEYYEIIREMLIERLEQECITVKYVSTSSDFISLRVDWAASDQTDPPVQTA